MNNKTEKLKSILKNDDQILPKLYVRPIANFIVGLIGDTKITPNQISCFSFILGIIASIFILFPYYWTLLAGSLIIQISWIFDSVDGQLARYKNLISDFGGWLDTIFDVIKGYLFGIAMGLHFYFITEKISWVIAGVMVGALHSLLTVFWENRKLLKMKSAVVLLSGENKKLTLGLKRYFHFGLNGIMLFFGLIGITNCPFILYLIILFLTLQFMAISYYMWKFEYKNLKKAI